MSAELEHWDKYWSDKKGPLHTDDSPEYYAKYAKELALLFSKEKYDKVLELGAGSGDFYELLNFHKADYYKGTDLSQTMLDEFAKQFPQANLEKASAHDYLDNKKYDLIYSNGVMQNLDDSMLREHFLNAEKMLANGGEIIDASLPWSVHRKAFMMLKLGPPYSTRSKAGIKSSLLWLANITKLKRDSMGHWRTPNQISKIASEFGLTGEYIGSMYYPYRFHAILKRA